MNEMPAKLKARAARKNAKRDEKKRQIAESAIEALKELGYANTSLRDIAAKSDSKPVLAETGSHRSQTTVGRPYPFP